MGGDAQLVALAVTGELGGCIFFIDPMDAHPHTADIECLVRQGNVHNILMMDNPTTAHVCMNACRIALKTGHMEMIPSFFFDLESPSVEAYKLRQKAVLQSNMTKKENNRTKTISFSNPFTKSAKSDDSNTSKGKTVTFAKKSVVVDIMDNMNTDDPLNILGE